MENAYVENYIRAVIAAAKPKKMPVALANATGISLCSLNKPYATHNVQLIAATNGWIQSPVPG